MKTILLIEDTPDMRENIAEILQLVPYRVVQASNGKQGVELARQMHPDLILCDIMMPELDGYGVLQILGNDPGLSATPFLFLTAKAEISDFRLGMSLGADDYLIKPFDDLTLLNAVEIRLKKGERGQAGPSPDAGLEKLARAILNEEDARQSLCENYPTVPFKKNQTLFATGNSPVALYFVSEGKVKVFKTDLAGNEYITGLYGKGDFLGYLALVKEEAYAETAEIFEEAQVCLVPKKDFMTLIYHNQRVANEFIRMLTSNVIEHQQQLLQLAYQSVRKRVAEALLLFQRKFYPQADDSPFSNTSPAMTLSRENWSHLAGASTETVIRILSDLRAEGLIGINASQITLLDIKRLSQLKHRL